MSAPRLRIGITLGDVNGIGPEVALKAALTKRWPADVQLVLIGAPEAVAAVLPANKKLPPVIHGHDHFPDRPKVICWLPDGSPVVRPAPGKVRVDASRAACHWIAAAVDACQSGRLNAMVTAPICKEGLMRAGIDYPGHTEMIAELTGRKRFAMMLIGGPLRVLLATRHIPIREVSSTLSGEGIREAILLADEGARLLGVKNPRLGVCGLNPHAGDGGAIGTEDRDMVAPAVKAMKRKGIQVEGPVPSDTIFHFAVKGAYDAIVAMYHDQGLAPLKMLAFDEGVNVTLGLPIVRTSPDHGTAFGIAGRNEANPSSTVEAIRTACLMAAQKNPWAGRRS